MISMLDYFYINTVLSIYVLCCYFKIFNKQYMCVFKLYAYIFECVICTHFTYVICMFATNNPVQGYLNLTYHVNNMHVYFTLNIRCKSSNSIILHVNAIENTSPLQTISWYSSICIKVCTDEILYINNGVHNYILM